MNLTAFWPWLLKTTLQGSLLAVLILLIRTILGDRLPARWHYGLWLVLLVRLALPWAPQSRVSLYNLIPGWPSVSGLAWDQQGEGPPRAVLPMAGPPGQQGRPDRPSAGDQAGVIEPAERGPAGPASAGPLAGSNPASEGPFPGLGDQTARTGASIIRLLPWLWLLGAALLAGTISIRSCRLWRAVRSERPVTDQRILDLLEDCKMQMRVRTLVAVVVTDRVHTPVLFGFLRPRILLPQGLVESMDMDDLEYVFLHELAHLKRLDIYTGWLVCLVQVLHWFNPLVWLAFRRMRADQESATDALALRGLNAGEPVRYGQTIMKLLEGFSQRQYLPSVAGILEDTSHIERRIHMIARFNHSSRRPLLAMVLLAVLGLITLTDAQNKSQGGEPASRPEEETGLAPDRSAPVAPQVTGGSATETPSLGGGLVARRVLADASGIGEVLTADGKYISSNMDRSTGDVVQFEVASGQRTRITNRGPWTETDKSYENQAFSRDGKQIAYNVESSDPNTKAWVFQVRIRNLDGSRLRTLYKDCYAYPLDWSPDAGSILALRDRNKATELTVISTADGSVRVLRSITSGWFSFQRASFSPDGRFVAFSLVREGNPPNGDVLLMTADGRNEVVVAGHPAEDRLLRWTPDGRSLVFLSDRSGTWDIWTVHITGGKQQGEPELLKKDFGYDSEVLGFAPDGSLYYKTQTYLGCLYHGEVDLETGKILVPPAPVTTRYTGPVAQPTWSPDGRNLAYLSHPGFIGLGNNILTIRSAATGEERFLSPRLRYVNQICWAPDGRSVIAVAITGTGLGIFRIDTETSGITKLTDGGLAPHLCPDGKTLVFVNGETGRPGPIIRKRNLDTGEESELVLIRGIIYDLSPDGREVVFQVGDAVKTVSLNGGQPRELFRGLAQRHAGLSWTRDGRYIIAEATGTASSEIWRVPAQGGTPLKLDLAVPKMNDFTLNPDNRRFAFSVDEGSKSELWVMENFLPAGSPVSPK